MGKREYDFVVVGAGTVGCVIAARLSEHPAVRVLLQPDNSGSCQIYAGTVRHSENPQVGGWLSRPGERIGYHAHSLPPV